MRRREFIALLGGVAAAWPVAGRAQAALPVIGFLNTASPEAFAHLVDAFRRGLNKTGYVDGENVIIEYRWARGHYDQVPELAGQLVERGVNVLAAFSPPAALAAKAATASIPIVIVSGDDPVKLGLIASLNRPSGNVTGIYVLGTEAIKKRLQLFKDAFPEQHAAFGFWDFDAAATWRIAADAAPSLGIALAGVEVRDAPYDYERGLLQVEPESRGALFMPNSAVFVRDAKRLVAFALHHRMVSSFDAQPLYVDAGGLMSYGADLTAAGRRAAEFADRIARGAKPSDLPIEQSTRFTLRINLKTAKTLGVTFAPTFLATADEVIE